MRLHRLPVIVSSAVLLAALTACSGQAAGGGSAPSGGGAASAGSSDAAAAPAAPAGDITKGEQVCALVSAGDLAGAAKTDPAVSKQNGSELPSLVPDQEDVPFCTYSSEIGDGEDIAKVIVVAAVKSAKGVDLSKAAIGSGPLTPVSGIGDKAAINDAEIDVVVGDRLLSVQTAGDTALGRDQLQAVAKLFAAKL